MDYGLRTKLDRLRSPFARANADAVFQRQDEDLAIADAALRTGAARLHDRLDGRLDEVLVDGDLQLHLTQQIDRQFVAAVDLGVTLLAPEALHVNDGQAEDLDLVEGFFHSLQLRGLDD